MQLAESPRFKIRRRRDGLFSTGGRTPGWTKRGKLWNSLAALKLHLSTLSSLTLVDAIDWEIVTYELRETRTNNLEETLRAINQERVDRRLKQQEAARNAQRRYDEAEFHRLKSKLGL